MIEYQSGNYHDKNWNDMVGTYSEPVILDKETAVEVAKAIFNGMNTSENMNGHVPKSIFYDEQDEIWIISFGEDSDENTLGGRFQYSYTKNRWESLKNMGWRVIFNFQ